jgi:hypothetical protein
MEVDAVVSEAEKARLSSERVDFLRLTPAVTNALTLRVINSTLKAALGNTAGAICKQKGLIEVSFISCHVSVPLPFLYLSRHIVQQSNRSCLFDFLWLADDYDLLLLGWHKSKLQRGYQLGYAARFVTQYCKGGIVVCLCAEM